MIDEIMQYAIDNNCSDIHIAENRCGVVRKRGDLIFLKCYRKVETADLIDFIKKYVTNDISPLEHMQDIDAACNYNGKRLRANIFNTSHGTGIALRLLSDTIPTIEQLRLPKELYGFTNVKTGLVLVIGTTGSGKSTTLATMINEINHTQAVNILTGEQPIEYIYESDKALISQREIGTHVESFADFVRSAMREDPDVVLVGELRDLDTISNAITLAETGHMVFGTLHAKSVAETVDRLIDVFPADGQEQIRVQLSSVLKAVIYQKLVPDTKKGRLPLIELMAVDDVISSMIKQKQKPNALRDYIRTKKDTGCIHLVDNIVFHSRNGDLDYTTVKPLLTAEDYRLIESILTAGNRKKGFAYGG